MSKQIIRLEMEKWLDSDVETALIELKQLTDEQIKCCIGEKEESFIVTYPKDYPQSKDKFTIASEDSNLAAWIKAVNRFALKDNLTLTELLNFAAEKYLEQIEIEQALMDDDDDIFGTESVYSVSSSNKNEASKNNGKEERKFLEIGSPSATMRLLKDLKNIHNAKTEELGFVANPIIDTETSMENLYHWEVKLFGFEKNTALYKDMIKYKKQTGEDFILLELRFSKDYPFLPPFARVVRPRFAFRTGHITIGGSICMELLTNSGWNSTNDIESILIQIRSEILSGDGRLDSGDNKNYQYSESEAWDAFYRAALTHGWDVKGLSQSTFVDKS